MGCNKLHLLLACFLIAFLDCSASCEHVQYRVREDHAQFTLDSCAPDAAQRDACQQLHVLSLAHPQACWYSDTQALQTVCRWLRVGSHMAPDALLRAVHDRPRPRPSLRPNSRHQV